MITFYFKQELVPAILSGRKKSTITSIKHGNVGQKIQLYTMARHRLIKYVEFTAIYKIHINEYGLVSCKHPDAGYLWRLEGFQSPKEFIDFFKDSYGLPFTGFLHEWGRL